MRRFFISWILLGLLLVSCRPHKESGQVQVAILDGAPVYHWRNFPSIYRNDINRALILRDFQRHGFHLPDSVVDKTIAEKIEKDYGGDRTRLIAALERHGETMSSYRQFTAEEIILKASLKRETQLGHDGRPPIPESEWLASLRKDVRVQILQVARPLPQDGPSGEILRPTPLPTASSHP